MKISLIATIFNEEKVILDFLKSITIQSLLPDEVVLVDGRSTDNTLSVISNFKSQISKKKIKFKIIQKKGNRSVGRNEAIKQVKGDIILISDAGCVLRKDWVEKIIEPFINPNVQVVAGYYSSKPKNIFQKCLVPYVLVMPDRVDPKTFLPATRSMAFRKKIWKKLGGFDERFSHNEDYVFARKLKKNTEIIFKKDAIVYWKPRKNLREAFSMFFRFSLGDGEAFMIRPKVVFIYMRYLFLALLIYFSLKDNLLMNTTIFLSLMYIIWSIEKNYKYIRKKESLFFLPLLQFTSDFAILNGTSLGWLKGIFKKTYFFLKENKFFTLIISLYSLVMLTLINWGLPNQNHPFNYQMDEWHQLQAVRSMFKYGSPNVPGSAHGTMLYFFLSGVYLTPFFILGIVNPFMVKSSITELDIQTRIFQILRLNTLLFGVLSILMFYLIIKKYFKINNKIALTFFVFSPIWISLSNYFKYDIALIFWILLSMFAMLNFIKKPTSFNYIIAAIPSSLSLATKISALPIFLLYISTFFLSKQKFSTFIKGLVLFSIIFITFGIPDIILGRAKGIDDFFSSNIFVNWNQSFSLIKEISNIKLILFDQYPLLFGHGLYIVYIVSFLYFLIKLFIDLYNKNINNKYNLFLFMTTFWFALSLIPLKLGATSNRALVLLPSFVIYSSLLIKKISEKIPKKIFLPILIIIMIVQLFESFVWLSIKYTEDPRVSSSSWIKNKIPKETVIGIENIPIYQLLPDVIVKEFYSGRNLINGKRFRYVVFDNTTQSFPDLVIITNEEIKDTQSFLNKSIVQKLKDQNYKTIAEFKTNLNLYRLFGNEWNFYFSNIIPSPVTIKIYKKI